jgi:hypothetical protein
MGLRLTNNNKRVAEGCGLAGAEQSRREYHFPNSDWAVQAQQRSGLWRVCENSIFRRQSSAGAKARIFVEPERPD